MMKKTAICCALLGVLIPSLACAELISDFEEPGLASKLNGYGVYEGETETPSTFRSGAVEFFNDGVYWSGSSWSGFGISQKQSRTAANIYDEGDDLIAKPAIGAAGSATWSVVGSGGTMKADAGYLFRSLAITSTLYTWTAVTEGDSFSGPPLQDGGGTGRYEGTDDFFSVRFTDPRDNEFLDFPLADFRGEDDYIIDSWTTVDLTSLAANELSISFLGSRETSWDGGETYYLDTPAYAALDEISVAAVPEPSSCGLLSLAAAGAAYYRRRKRRRDALIRSARSE